MTHPAENGATLYGLTTEQWLAVGNVGTLVFFVAFAVLAWMLRDVW